MMENKSRKANVRRMRTSSNADINRSPLSRSPTRKAKSPSAMAKKSSRNVNGTPKKGLLI